MVFFLEPLSTAYHTYHIHKDKSRICFFPIKSFKSAFSVLRHVLVLFLHTNFVALSVADIHNTACYGSTLCTILSEILLKTLCHSVLLFKYIYSFSISMYVYYSLSITCIHTRGCFNLYAIYYKLCKRIFSLLFIFSAG